MNDYVVLIDGLDHTIYMYKSERVSILEGTGPFVNGPFVMFVTA